MSCCKSGLSGVASVMILSTNAIAKRLPRALGQFIGNCTAFFSRIKRSTVLLAGVSRPSAATASAYRLRTGEVVSADRSRPPQHTRGRLVLSCGLWRSAPSAAGKVPKRARRLSSVTASPRTHRHQGTARGLSVSLSTSILILPSRITAFVPIILRGLSPVPAATS